VTFEVVHDDASFGLYDSSFDSLSDPGVALSLGIDDGTMTDASHQYSNRPANRSGNRILSPSTKPYTTGLNDIDLPELNSPSDNFESSQLSLGDLSPIKLIYSEGSAPTVERQATLHTSDTCRSKESDFDWTSDEIDLFHSSTRSNPFYVLRSVQKAFNNIRYRLPCLFLPSEDSNHITMSSFGSIRQYKGVTVSFQTGDAFALRMHRFLTHRN
jgi:hypothetical protein